MVRLVIEFDVEGPHEAAFESMYSGVYLAALRKQPGFEGSALCKSYTAEVLAEIGAEGTRYNYAMMLDFESEAARRSWVASNDHDPAWNQATALARAYTYRGYDVVAQG